MREIAYRRLDVSAQFGVSARQLTPKCEVLQAHLFFLTSKNLLITTEQSPTPMTGCKLALPWDPQASRTEMPISRSMATTVALVSSVELTRQSLTESLFLLTNQTRFFSTHTEIIKKGTVFMNIAMYVIRELEDALVDCENGCAKGECNADPVSALDEAVAFYTGALEGTDGSGNGNLMHALADKRCVNFKTCGREGNADSGTSRVNYEIFKLFDRMQDELSGSTADKCAAARITKEKIVPLMFVPLIQGTLRYAYITENEGYSEKSEAEGAAFAAAVLPMVAACNMNDANIIYSNMRVGQKNSATYADVSAAFERQYDCLGITCADVGGVWNSANAMYEDGAGPCGTSSSSNSANVGLAVGLTFLGLALVVLLVVVVRRRGSSSRRTISARKGEQQDQLEAQEAPVI